MNQLKTIEWDETNKCYLYNGVMLKTQIAKQKYSSYARQIKMFTRMENTSNLRRINFDIKTNENNETEYYIKNIKVELNGNDEKRNVDCLYYEQTIGTPTKGYFYADKGGRIIAKVMKITKTDKELTYNQIASI